MSERNGARFEGMVLAKLSGLDERMDELLNAVRAMEEVVRFAPDNADARARLETLREKLEAQR